MNADAAISCFGFCVSPCERIGGGFIFAEVTPAPRWNWRPSSGRTSRWWYEVHATSPTDPHRTTLAYEDGGSGGAFTLRRCVDRASVAVDKFVMAEIASGSEAPITPAEGTT